MLGARNGAAFSSSIELALSYRLRPQVPDALADFRWGSKGFLSFPSLVGSTSIIADSADVDQECRVMHEPGHDRMVGPNLPLVPGLECKSHGSCLTLYRLDSIFDSSIGLVFSDRRILCKYLDFSFLLLHLLPCEFNRLSLLPLDSF